jgi:hypothetical protein
VSTATVLARYEDRYWRWATWGVFLFLVVFIALTFDQHGISNDEPVQRNYGHMLLDFYRSGFQDYSAFSYRDLYLYGGLFDMIAAALEPLVPIAAWDLRHLLTAMCGFGGTVLAARLARALAGERAGFFAVLALALTGAWSGAMFTHTKDIPFAAAMIYATYAITRLLPTLPKPSWPQVINVGIAIGIAIGLRVGAILAVFYLGVAACLTLLWQPNTTNSFFQRALQCTPRLLAALAIAAIVMAFAWPWSVMGWDHVFKAATAFSDVSYTITTIMNGVYYKIVDVPGSYLPMYLLVRLPEFALSGIVFAIAFASLALIRRRIEWQALLLFTPTLLAAAFPITFALLTAPAMYNGVRHFTFVLPPLAVIAALGLDAAWMRLKSRRLVLAVFAVALIGLAADAATTLARLHPYQYVAYNHLVGGLRGAYDRWEMDYWGDSLREAAALLTAWTAKENISLDRRHTVAICAESIQGATYLRPGLEITRDWVKADFFVSPTQTRCDDVLAGEIIGVVERDGVPLAVVKDRRKLVGEERRIR